MPASYTLKRDSDGQFYFVLYAANGEVVLTSETYAAKASAENGIASVQTNSSHDDRYSRNQAANGKFYFNLKAANHQVIGHSLMYSTTVARDVAIATVKKNGPTQSVVNDT
ncbi:YegP family protein [Glaciimonas sp. CA11.2]|uniref:YegP family protein n=1 Tax=unclassified Glaciimonas TaxID=2644401 RepID=UPI002AB4B45D|nr:MULTISPECIES: YegP family protein [unclassified Glaciimonas]MDY7545822.1 YegP family protein [Glaciimonas sp. CA11.2]MEB0011532.1 YegP family protein [Glaciimonas sp. Cout2]MEB0081329.1 YegP family protein [Glaciimonas sp. Gout2]MEB0162244.1 YegP family protein [Glaciimonas sp. CA11.2]